MQHQNPEAANESSIDEPQYRWIREHGPLHIPDVTCADTEFRTISDDAGGSRDLLAVPLLHDGQPIGAIGVDRSPRMVPFTTGG